MDQSPLTRFIKVFELKNEAIVFQNSVNTVLDTVNGFMGGGGGDTASDKVDTIPTNSYGGGGSGTSSTVQTGLLATIMKIPNEIGKLTSAAFKFISPVSGPAREGESSPDMASSAVQLGALGIGAVGTIVFALYAADRAQRSSRRRIGNLNRRNDNRRKRRNAEIDEEEEKKEDQIIRALDLFHRRLDEIGCNAAYTKCLHFTQPHQNENTNYGRICQDTRRDCLREGY
jgi:hypothetical protein